VYDGSKIIPGLLLFVGLVTYPTWHNGVSGKSGYVPKPKIPAEEKACVEPTAFIRIHHKGLLEEWKTSVVRGGMRTYKASNGKTYTMSLNKTCMNCHKDRAEFCDRCHQYVGVSNKCWDCHMYPKEMEQG
jgi:hypothetical protein